MENEHEPGQLPPLPNRHYTNRISKRLIELVYYFAFIGGSEITIDGAATSFKSGDLPKGLLDIGIMGFIWTMYYMNHLHQTDRAQNTIAQRRMFENPYREHIDVLAQKVADDLDDRYGLANAFHLTAGKAEVFKTALAGHLMAREILVANQDEEALLEAFSAHALITQDPIEVLTRDQMPLMHPLAHDRLLADASEQFEKLPAEEAKKGWNMQNIEHAAREIAKAYRQHIVDDLLLAFAPIILETSANAHGLSIRQRIRRKRYIALTEEMEEAMKRERNSIDEKARPKMESAISNIVYRIGTN